MNPGAISFVVLAALTLFEAVDRALAQHPSVRSAQASVEAANASVGEAKAQWWPSLDLTASATRYSDPMVVTPIHGFRPTQLPEFDRTLLQAGIHLESLLFDAGGRSSRIKITRAQEEAARASLDEAEQRLVADVARAYLETLGQDAILRAHDQRMEALAAESTRVSNLFEAGRAARVDQLRAEAELAQARAERTVAAAALDVAERELARSIAGSLEETRVEALVDVVLQDAPVPPREALEQEALRANPARRRSESDLAAAKAGVPLAKSERFPSVHLLAGLLDRGSPETEFETEWNAGLHLHLPLFTGGALRSGVRRAEALRLRAQEDLRLHEDVLREDVDRAVARIEETRAQTAELATASSRFEEVARVSLLQVETGTGTQIDYLQAEADLLRARAAHARARYSEVAAHIELQRALGTLDVDWMRETLRRRTMKAAPFRRATLRALTLAACTSLALAGCGKNRGGKDLVASGTVEATEAQLGFPATGRIDSISVREGERVTQGQKLAVLDSDETQSRLEEARAHAQAMRAALVELERGSRPEEVAQAKAALDAARVQHADAVRNHQRAKKLLEGGAVSQEVLDDAVTREQVAKSDLERAEESLRMITKGPRQERIAQQRALTEQAEAQARTLEATLSNLTIVSPMNGIVTVRHREPGEIAPAGSAIVTVMDPQDRWVSIYVSENRIGQVKLAASATLTADSFPKKTYRGRVESIASEAEFTPKNVQTTEERVKLVYEVKVRIEGDEGLDLKPGMPADVRLELPRT